MIVERGNACWLCQSDPCICERVQETYPCACPSHTCSTRVDFDGDRCPMCTEACGPGLAT